MIKISSKLHINKSKIFLLLLIITLIFITKELYQISNQIQKRTLIKHINNQISAFGDLEKYYNEQIGGTEEDRRFYKQQAKIYENEKNYYKKLLDNHH